MFGGTRASGRNSDSIWSEQEIRTRLHETLVAYSSGETCSAHSATITHRWMTTYKSTTTVYWPLWRQVRLSKRNSRTTREPNKNFRSMPNVRPAMPRSNRFLIKGFSFELGRARPEARNRLIRLKLQTSDTKLSRCRILWTDLPIHPILAVATIWFLNSPRPIEHLPKTGPIASGQ